MKKKTVINGDPNVLNSKYRIPIHWYDRVFNDQMEAYTDEAENIENSNDWLGWKEYKEDFSENYKADALEFRWWEYEGKNRNSDFEAPLIVIMDEYFNTVWQRLADDNNLVLIATEYHRPQLDPPGTPEYCARECELDVYKQLIDRMCEKYNINRKRIYFFGLSYGDMTAYMFIRKYKELLGGAVFMNGCVRGASLCKYRLPDDLVLPTLHLRADSDYNVDGYFDGLNFDAKGNKGWLKHMRARNVGLLRKNWIKCIKAGKLPDISSEGDSVFLTYRGKKVPMIYNELEGHSHIAPLSYAQVAWEQIFKVFERNSDGTIGVIGESPLEPDKDAVALAIGCSKAYVNNCVVKLDAPCLIVEPAVETPFEQVLFAEENVNKESFYAPLDILNKGFGIKYMIENEDNHSVWTCEAADDRVELDDKVISFEYGPSEYVMYTNCPLVKIDGRYVSMGRPVLTVEGMLMIPAKEFAEMLGKFCSVNNGAAYISQKPMTMGYALPLMLREEILGDKFDIDFKVKVKVAGHRNVSNATLTNLGISLKWDDGINVNPCSGTIPEGAALIVEVSADSGVTVMTPFINGIDVPFFNQGVGEYRVENVFGDITVELKK